MTPTASPTPVLTRVAAAAWLVVAVLSLGGAAIFAVAAFGASSGEVGSEFGALIALVALVMAGVVAIVCIPVGILVWRNSRVGHVLSFIVCGLLALWVGTGAMTGSVVLPAAIVMLLVLAGLTAGSIVGLRARSLGQ